MTNKNSSMSNEKSGMTNKNSPMPNQICAISNKKSVTLYAKPDALRE
jgi:hypothetical protein